MTTGWRCPKHPDLTFVGYHPANCEMRVRHVGTRCVKCGDVNPRPATGFPAVHAKSGCGGEIVEEWEECGEPLEFHED